MSSVTWYIPSWNGDFRLLPTGEVATFRDAPRVDDSCVLEIEDPTDWEVEKLQEFLTAARKKKWTPKNTKVVGGAEKQHVLMTAPMAEVGSLLLKVLKGDQLNRTLTALKFESGRVSVVEAGNFDLAEEIAKAVAAKDKATKAASVTRPTPCCPQCVLGAVDRASEVLLSFLTPEQHETWARDRYIVVEGHASRHRYVIAHRHSALAVGFGRICFDVDDQAVIHFHDNSVPPEEEVLAAKLIMEHRESWLRNEATLFIPSRVKFKNPFGGYMDGVSDAGITQGIGAALSAFAGVKT